MFPISTEDISFSSIRCSLAGCFILTKNSPKSWISWFPSFLFCVSIWLRITSTEWMIFSSFWKLIISNFSIADDFSLKNVNFHHWKSTTYKRPVNLEIFLLFLFPSFYIFAKQNQTRYERHYIRKIKGIIPEEWL